MGNERVDVLPNAEAGRVPECMRGVRYLWPSLNLQDHLAAMPVADARSVRTFFESKRDVALANIATLAKLMLAADQAEATGVSVQEAGGVLQTLADEAELGETVSMLADNALLEFDAQVTPHERTKDRPRGNAVNPILEACDDVLQIQDDAVAALTQFLKDGNRKEVEAALVNLAAVKEAAERAHLEAVRVGAAL
jgi:hypothetical protein